MDPRAKPPDVRPSITAEHAMTLAIVGFVAGVAIGAASGRLIVGSAGATFLVGPTWAGIALALGGLVAFVTGTISLLTRNGRWWVVPLFAASSTLALGVLVGIRINL